jgi:tetrahydromethanopterin S-methyltransferase subunit F
LINKLLKVVTAKQEIKNIDTQIEKIKLQVQAFNRDELKNSCTRDKYITVQSNNHATLK